ncbi:MAG: hypothetical protein JO133_08240 [Burkholderiaceae bacterium]|nr:hypothetical protein [Burkholderiaceae bacterium]
MNALLVRVGADRSAEGGRWNGVVDAGTGAFVYVPIPERRPVYAGYERRYMALAQPLQRFGQRLPRHLERRRMHLDPDFEQLTYGDERQRAKQLRSTVGAGDWIVFYASLLDVHGSSRLVYALIGLFAVEQIAYARDLPTAQRDCNAHTRRRLAPEADDIVVIGKPGASGRLRRCLSIGEWRNGAYRLRQDLIEAWGGLSVNDGWLQRSARLPRFLDPEHFRSWLAAQRPELIARNNE